MIFQVGDILYGPKADSWLEDEHSSVMLISCIFVWHITVLIIIFILLAVCISVCYKKHYNLQTSNAMYDKLLDKSDQDCDRHIHYCQALRREDVSACRHLDVQR